jgi:hypothetical protein
MQHDSFSRNTRAQLRQVFEALRELTMPPEPANRAIGFVPPEKKKDKPAGKAAAKAAAGRFEITGCDLKSSNQQPRVASCAVQFTPRIRPPITQAAASS